MAEKADNQEVFYSRNGMNRRGPFTRKYLRHLLAAGLMDAHSLIRDNTSNVMLPLGASKAASEITWVARHWHWQHTISLYWAWLVFTPLFSAGVAGIAIVWSSKAFFIIPAAIFIGNIGMALWLYQKWLILLAEEKNVRWKAALYALPMAIPVVNCIWIWFGYLQLPKHWRRFKQLHNIPDNTPYYLYYLVVAVFYMMIVSETIFFCVEENYEMLWLQITGSISWLWYGLTLMSLFFTDQITLHLIHSKLRNLAFGAISCCADINYDTLHQAVLAMYRRANGWIFAIGGVLLFCSWLFGGWLWLRSVEIWYTQPSDVNIWNLLTRVFN